MTSGLVVAVLPATMLLASVRAPLLLLMPPPLYPPVFPEIVLAVTVTLVPILEMPAPVLLAMVLELIVTVPPDSLTMPP